MVREVRRRLDEIDVQIAQWEALVRERQYLRGLLIFYERGGDLPLMRTLQAAPQVEGPPIKMPPPVRRDKRTPFSPQPNSRTNRVAQAFRAVLERLPAGEPRPFVDVLDQIPHELVGDGPNARETVRTAIKRAGHRFGVRYDDGEVSLVGIRAASA